MAKFKKGQSGNPVGRPKGKSTLQELRELLKPHAEELVTKVVEMAKTGDSAALRLCLERLIPPIKARDTPITLDKFTGTLTEQGQYILEAMARSDLTPSEATSMLQALGAQGRIVELDELEKRVRALEDVRT